MDNELKQVFDFEDNDEMDLCLWCGDLLPSWQLNVNDGYCSQCLDKRPGSPRQRFWNAVVWLLGLLAMFLLTDFVIDAVHTTENFIIGFLIGILWITILYLLISSLED